MKQPDLSTSIVIVFIIVCLIFVAGLSYKWIIGAAAVGIPGLALTVFLAERGAVPFLTGYQVNRILAFINPGKFADLNVQQDNSKMADPRDRIFPEKEEHDRPSCSRKAGIKEGKAMAAARGV